MEYKVKYLCNLAQVSGSGYYAYLKSGNAQRDSESRDSDILKYVKKAMNYKNYKKDLGKSL